MIVLKGKKYFTALETAIILGESDQTLSNWRKRDRAAKKRDEYVKGPRWTNVKMTVGGKAVLYLYEADALKAWITRQREQGLVDYKDRLDRLTNAVKPQKRGE